MLRSLRRPLSHNRVPVPEIDSEKLLLTKSPTGRPRTQYRPRCSTGQHWQQGNSIPAQAGMPVRVVEYTPAMDDPADGLLRISMSHGLPRCLHAVAELGIADALGESPRSAEELARDTGTDAGALARTLRVLSAEGIFEARDGAWGHTPASRLLRSEHPQSMRSFVRMIGLPVYWRGFEYFADALRTGESVQEKVVPGGYWKYLTENPEAARLFDEAMIGKAAGQIAGVLGSYDFSAFETIADIGGGRGHLLAAVLQAAPRAHGVCSISRM